MSLNVLFEQILKSEQHAENRHAQLVQTNQKIAWHDGEIRKLTQLVHELENKTISEISNQLHKEKSELEFLSQQHHSLSQQQAKIIKSINDNEITLNRLKDEKQKQFDDFLEEVQQFTESSDLFSTCQDDCKEKQVEELEDYKKKMEAELSEVKGKKKCIIEMQKHISRLAREISHLRESIIEYDSALEEKRQKVVEEKQKLEKIWQVLHEEPDYIRLQEQLQVLDKELNVDKIQASLRVFKEQHKREPQ
ncbi:uncharacterized protein LOC143465912 [Clavelina lepadiformis]|uniref:uncharacterized protein LOC143465912 n=1 Tax=Clavelina lepadiformis TaxID=159417 RepID=UPI0040438C87